MSQKLALSDLYTKQVLNCLNKEKGEHKDVRNRLAFQNVIGNTLLTLEKNNRHIDDSLNNIKDQLEQIKKRIKHLELDLQSASKLKVQNENNEIISDSYSHRLAGGRDSVGSTSCLKQSLDDRIDLEQMSKQSAKLGNYNNLVAKYANRSTRQDKTISKKDSFPKPLQPIKSSMSTKVLNILNMHSSPDYKLTKFIKRVSERRQYKMNMLSYHKSRSSLRVNSIKYNFSKTLHKEQSKSNSKKQY